MKRTGNLEKGACIVDAHSTGSALAMGVAHFQRVWTRYMEPAVSASRPGGRPPLLP